jgi:hypothetical protein
MSAVGIPALKGGEDVKVGFSGLTNKRSTNNANLHKTRRCDLHPEVWRHLQSSSQLKLVKRL